MYAHTPNTPQPQKPKKNTAGVIAAIVIVVAVIFGGFVACSALVATTTNDPAAVGQHGATATAPSDTASPSDTPSAYQPTKSDFTLKAKILSRDCFGSAGCNVTYRIKLSYAGPPLSADHQYEVTYKVTGADDGAQVGTLTMTGDHYETDGEELASTPSADTQLKVHVTDVEQVS